MAAVAQAPDSAPDAKLQPQQLLRQVGQNPAISQTANGDVFAEGASFRARFAPAGVSIETASDGETLPRLELQFLGSSRGFVHHAATANVKPQLAGDTVRFAREGLVETYAVGANGYEQSFHIAQKPQGHGDLVLSMAVSGNVTAEPLRNQHNAIEFAFEGTRAIRYGEATVFDRAGNRAEVRTSFDGIGRLDLIVPAAFLDSATFPIVVDPAVGPVLIADGASWQDSEPDVAHNAAGDRFMLVWQRTFTAANHGIRGQIFAGDGTALTSYITLTQGGDRQAPAIAFCNAVNPEAFLVVYSDSGTIWGTLVSTSGNILGSPILISSPGHVDVRPTVSGPGNGVMLVAWERGPVGSTNSQSVHMRELYFPNPNTPGTVNMGPERTLFSVNSSSGYVRNVRLARSDVAMDVSGTTWFANRISFDRWWTSPAPGDWDVYTGSFRVNPNGFGFQIIDPIGVADFADGIGTNELNADIGSRANSWLTGAGLQYLLAWEEEGDVKACMYDINGATSAAEIVVDDSATTSEVLPAVGAGFCEFTVAYGVITPPNEFDVDIYAARVLLDGTVAINRRLVDDPGGQFQNGIAASSRPITTSPVQPRNTSLLTWMGQTGPAGGLNDVRARFFEPVAPLASPFGTACMGPLGELPAIGTSGGPAIAGNDDFRFTVTNAPANSLAVLVIGDTLTTVPVPGAPGCNLYMGLPLLNVLPTVTDNTGFGSVALPIPCSIPHNTTLAFQWGVYTPGHNAFGWITSDDMDVSWSHF